MADFAAFAPRPRTIERRRADDDSARFDKAIDRATGPLAAHGGQPHPDIKLGVDDMAAVRLTPGAAIEARHAHLAAIARDMDIAGRQSDGRIAPRSFDRRLPVLAALLGVAIAIAALVLF